MTQYGLLSIHSRNKMPFSQSPLPAGDAYEPDTGYDLIDINALVTRGHPDVRAAEITGDSGVPTIHPGSIVFYDCATPPKQGDMVVACLNGRNCVKILDLKHNGLFLVSANKGYPPTEVTKSDELYILGVVIGSLQLFRGGGWIK